MDGCVGSQKYERWWRKSGAVPEVRCSAAERAVAVYKD
jgi:hypothetical protein